MSSFDKTIRRNPNLTLDRTVLRQERTRTLLAETVTLAPVRDKFLITLLFQGLVGLACAVAGYLLASR